MIQQYIKIVFFHDKDESAIQTKYTRDKNTKINSILPTLLHIRYNNTSHEKKKNQSKSTIQLS
ncbi:hypothetical protein, partial [Enterobacter roggenkampii]|uniref:hypothetical protein n=1 Tax=Enterobacter roggenkampii TaxID=1812935 RepID=UPI00197A7921